MNARKENIGYRHYDEEFNKAKVYIIADEKCKKNDVNRNLQLNFQTMYKEISETGVKAKLR